MKNCCKCKEANATVIIRHACYCYPCFHNSFGIKYRAVLGKSSSFAGKRGKVLLACSGGPSSIAMLQLTCEYNHVDTREKKKVQRLESVTVCHLDESALFGDKKETGKTMEEIVKRRYPAYDFISRPLEDIFDHDFLTTSNFRKTFERVSGSKHDYEHLVHIASKDDTASTEKVIQFRNLFENIEKTTAKEDLYRSIKLAMLTRIAQQEGCTFMFLGDSSTRVAVKMISMTSYGRGYSIPFDVGGDTGAGVEGVTILRPMKDMLAKEIGLYNWFTGLHKDVVMSTNWSTKRHAKSSIERLTEDFIVGLDHDFPSTTSTITRTASKLTPAEGMDLNKRCILCTMPYQHGVTAWRKRITVNTCGETPPKECSSVGCGNDGNACCNTTADGGLTVDLNELLCYSCQVHVKDYKDDAIESLPPYVVFSADEKTREERLHSQIKDFLLSDDEETLNNSSS